MVDIDAEGDIEVSNDFDSLAPIYEIGLDTTITTPPEALGVTFYNSNRGGANHGWALKLDEFDTDPLSRSPITTSTLPSGTLEVPLTTVVNALEQYSFTSGTLGEDGFIINIPSNDGLLDHF